MSKLLEKLLKTGSASSSILSDADLFKPQDLISTEVPIINMAFSGDPDGGYGNGLTILAGESKTFKTMLALYCLKSYLDKNPDGIGILYDSEGGCNPSYVKSIGIDPARVIHIPIEHIEQLKFDFVKKLEEIKKGDKVFFLIDSIGQLASKKETDDALDEKSVADMTRAKAIRSLLRLVVIQLNNKMLPCFMINHVYSEIGLYPKTIIPGGTSVTYSANSILVVTKAQDKTSDGELAGWHFTLNAHKSRYVREKAKFQFTVGYESGIKKYSGLLDIALELGAIVSPSTGWYSTVDLLTGEINQKKYRKKELDTQDFWDQILSSKEFKHRVKARYSISSSIDLSDSKIDDIMDDTGE